MVKKLPIVKLYLNPETNEYDEDYGVERLFYADKRLKEYRAVDGQQPWIVKDSEVGLDIDDVVFDYEIMTLQECLDCGAEIDTHTPLYDECSKCGYRFHR